MGGLVSFLGGSQERQTGRRGGSFENRFMFNSN